jgi:predicted DNA-binding transcriptional regulator AlpA
MAHRGADRSYLGVTAMTIWRWERDPKLAFPAATVIHGRKYWSRDDIDAWMRRQATRKATRQRESTPAAHAELGAGHD